MFLTTFATHELRSVRGRLGWGKVPPLVVGGSCCSALVEGPGTVVQSAIDSVVVKARGVDPLWPLLRFLLC